jgi:NAD(P)-dependent dehydrogenase (short-subunit alcohol dehydrogenase family)
MDLTVQLYRELVIVATTLHGGALITGSTSGIGEAIAHELAAAGARVIVTGRRADRGEAVAAAIAMAGGKATFIAADLAGGAAAARALIGQATDAAGGELEVIVNNAAYLIGRTATTSTTQELIDDALAVSVRAPILVTAAAVPAMIKRRHGVIVNVGSINGLIGMAGAALYGATKAALHSLTKSWAAEFGPHGIRVNTVAPGPTLTGRNEAQQETLAPLLAAVPTGRMSTPREVAAAVRFLVSDDSANINGATLTIDGGYTAL